jgi:hypothetical protein
MNWVDDVYEELLASRRRRLNCRLAHAQAHSRTAALIQSAPTQVLRTAIVESGIRVADLRLALHGVEGWLALDPTRRAKLELVLGAQTRSKPAKSPVRMSSAGLKSAARKREWSARTQRQLWLAVERELRTAGAVHRLSAMTAADWIEAHERLFGSR